MSEQRSSVFYAGKQHPLDWTYDNEVEMYRIAGAGLHAYGETLDDALARFMARLREKAAEDKALAAR